jgi:hypothetical protein
MESIPDLDFCTVKSRQPTVLGSNMVYPGDYIYGGIIRVTVITETPLSRVFGGDFIGAKHRHSRVALVGNGDLIDIWVLQTHHHVRVLHDYYQHHHQWGMDVLQVRILAMAADMALSICQPHPDDA